MINSTHLRQAKVARITREEPWKEGVFVRRLGACVFLIGILLHASLPAPAQGFKPVGAFVYKVPNGVTLTFNNPSADLSGDLGALSIHNLQVFTRNNAISFLNGIDFVNKAFYIPIEYDLNEIATLCQRESSVKCVNSYLDDARKREANLLAQGDFRNIAQNGIHSGAPAFTPLFKAFTNHNEQLDKSIASAQSVVASINQWIASNQAGINLFKAATRFANAKYGRTMGEWTCDKLISIAADSAGSPVTYPSVNGASVTQTWFRFGMGECFREIYGGSTGLPLSQLVADEGSGKVELTLSSVIVADAYPGEVHGHAALFIGIIKVKGKTQLITYDANDSQGYSVSLAGDLEPADIAGAMLNFPGHVVGEHITGSQIGLRRTVKVFQPIGHYPTRNQLTVPRCGDSSPVQTSYLGHSLLEPGSDFKKCVAKLFPPLDLQHVKAACATASTFSERFGCFQHYQCLANAKLGLNLLESARLTCKKDGLGSVACNQYAAMITNPLQPASACEQTAVQAK